LTLDKKRNRQEFGGSRSDTRQRQVGMKRNVIRRKLVDPKSGVDNDSDARDGGVQSVDRALSIIEVLAEDDEGYRLTDLAVRTGLSTSTVHRLPATLEKHRFVQFDRTESKWHVGAQSFAVGATFTRRRNFTAQAMPYLRKLRDLTSETPISPWSTTNPLSC
jgi:IclR family acetate operon transcriptional repressor